MQNVTKRQLQVLAAIKRLTAKNGVPPSYRELQDELGITSPNGVACHLKALRRKRLVTWEWRAGRGNSRGRTLRVVEPKGIPIEGVVT